MRHVLTGGPGVGKTTVINVLVDRGFAILPETARNLIEEGVRNDSDCVPWKDLECFQRRVAEHQLKAESLVNDETIFLDRGIVDGVAYCVVGGVAVPKVILENGKNRYDKIFLLEPLKKYENDKERLEDKILSLKIHNEIIKAYEYFGYAIVYVPVLSPEDRVNFILDKI